MALIDEYKQAIKDVLDGRAKPAPKPSELPWSEDKAATMWAAAAAELIAEANAGGSNLPDTPGANGTYTLQNTVASGEGTLSWVSDGGSELPELPGEYGEYVLRCSVNEGGIATLDWVMNI